MDPQDVAQFVAASPDRLALLERLQESPGTPAGLAEDCDLSRRSVQRSLSAFVDRGWARKVGGEYRITTVGAVVAAEHAEYVAALELIGEFEPLYAHLPDRAHAPDPGWLDGATLAAATTDDPQAPVHFYVDRVRGLDADRIRMLSPVLSRLFHEAHAKLAIRGTHTDLVLGAETIERARKRNRTEFDVVVSVDVLDLYRHPGPVGVGLTLSDDRGFLSAYDEDGHLQACVESTDERFLSWAGDLFERYREESELIEPTIRLPFSLKRE